MDPECPKHTVQLGTKLDLKVEVELKSFLTEYKDVFSWSHKDMPRINLEVIVQCLNVDPSFKLVIQNRRSFNPERYQAINEEVEKLLNAQFIQEVHY